MSRGIFFWDTLYNTLVTMVSNNISLLLYHLIYPWWVEDIWSTLVPVSLHTEKLWTEQNKNFVVAVFLSSTIFSLEIVVWKLKTEILQLFWCRGRPAIIRQYDITNIVLIAIRPYNNTQIMDIIEKYDLFYNIQQEIIEKILIVRPIQ